MREIVLPGDFLEERKGRKLKNCYEEEGKVFSKFLGIKRSSSTELQVIPLFGKYLPKVGDRVIGIVRDIEVSGWWVDINSPYLAFLPLVEAVQEFVDVARADLSRYYDVGDVIFCKISKVAKSKIVQVSMRDMLSRKLYKGTVIRIIPMKIPRVIGKGGSMIQLIKQKTRCEIYAGQNGLVWVRGKEKLKVLKALMLIQREAHTTGLTERVGKLLGN